MKQFKIFIQSSRGELNNIEKPYMLMSGSTLDDAMETFVAIQYFSLPDCEIKENKIIHHSFCTDIYRFEEQGDY